MNILFLLVPIALLLAGAFLAAFFWATKNNQYEDLEGPALQLLTDDLPLKKINNNEKMKGSENV